MMEIVMVELDPNDLHRVEDLMRKHGFVVLESETVQGTSFVKVGVEDSIDAINEVADFMDDNNLSGYVDLPD